MVNTNFPLFFAVPNFFAENKVFCFVDIYISSRVGWLSRRQDKIEAPSKKGTHTKCYAWGRNLTSESDLEKWKTSLCRAWRSSQAWRTSFRVCRTISPLRRSILTTGPSNSFTRWQVAEIQSAGWLASHSNPLFFPHLVLMRKKKDIKSICITCSVFSRSLLLRKEYSS